MSAEPLFEMPEPPEPPEPKPTVTERDMLDALHRRYAQRYGNGERFATAEHVRSHAGFDARRTADFVAMDLWPSKRLDLHGHEVKVSRSDWLRELKEPEKAAEFIPYMNRWWVVAASPSIVKPDEIPPGWGLLVLAGRHLRVSRTAARHDAEPLSPTRLAALLRAVAKTSEYWAGRKP